MADERMKLKDLYGKRVRVVVNSKPCRISMDGVIPLERTTFATVERGMSAPGGVIVFVRDDANNRIGIDGLDITHGRVVLELHEKD